MKVRIKKFLVLLLVWISFGFSLNQYLGQELLPVDVEQDLSGDAALSDDEIGSDDSNVIVEPLTQDDFISEAKLPGLWINEVQLVSGKPDLEIKSLGEKQPLFTNETMRGRQKNRRVELIFKY